MKKMLLILWILGAYVFFNSARAQLVKPVSTLADSNLTFLGDWEGASYTHPIVIGDYMYVIHRYGMHILDVSNPDSMKFVREVPAPDLVQNLFIDGNYAYLPLFSLNWYLNKRDSAGVLIVDISDPLNAHEVGFISLSQYQVQDVRASGNYAYVACWDSGLVVVDISDLAAPRIVTTYKPQGPISKLAISGNYLYLGISYVESKYSGCEIVDISSPQNPVQAGLIVEKRHNKNPWITVDGNYLYYPNGYYGLSVYDVSNPSSPSEVATMSPSGEVVYAQPLNNYAYVVNNNGVTIYDVSTLSNPQKKGFFSSVNSDYVFVKDQMAYSIDSYGTLYFMDVSNVNMPNKIASYGTGEGEAKLSYAHGNYVYLAQGGDLFIFDISNLEKPVLLKKIEGSTILDLLIKGKYLYYTERNKGLNICDLSIPTKPVLITTIESSYDPIQKIFIQNNRLYCISSYELYVYDLSDPASPSLLGKFSSTKSFSPSALKVKDGYAYIASSLSGLIIIDVNDPANMSKVSEISQYWDMYDLEVYDHYVYMARIYKGLQIVDVSNPASPVEVGSLNVQNTNTLYLKWDHLYVREDYYMIAVYDLGSDPVSPKRIAYAELLAHETANDIFVSGWNVFISTQKGLQIYQNDLTVGVEKSQTVPQSFTLYPNFPNPFNPSTNIRFELPEVSRVKVEIFDLTGRKIRTLVNGVLPAGEHQVNWDGTDDLGRSVASGLYFYRLQNEEHLQTRKMILMR